MNDFIPQVPKKSRNGPILPTFNKSEFLRMGFLGKGSYGSVYHGVYRTKKIVVKFLDDADEDELTKEATILHKCIHPNIVSFIAINYPERAIMMEYCLFDFNYFNHDKVVTSLREYLKELHKLNIIKWFEVLHKRILVDCITGLKYLHDKGITHRDLKPGNLLVDNSFMSKAKDEEERKKRWKTNPIQAKLTDFGESWSEFRLTRTALKTTTVKKVKGTLVFSAPELDNSHISGSRISSEQLKMADVYSLGMLCFCLLSPDRSIPYFAEANPFEKNQFWRDYLKKKREGNILPELGEQYSEQQEGIWQPIFKIFQSCSNSNPSLRYTLNDALKCLRNRSCGSGSINNIQKSRPQGNCLNWFKLQCVAVVF